MRTPPLPIVTLADSGQYILRAVRCRGTVARDDEVPLYVRRRHVEPERTVSLRKGSVVEVYGEVYIGGIGGCVLFAHDEGFSIACLAEQLPYLRPLLEPLIEGGDVPPRLLCLGGDLVRVPHADCMYGAIVADPNNGYPLLRRNPRTYAMEVAIAIEGDEYQDGTPRGDVPWTPCRLIVGRERVTA